MRRTVKEVIQGGKEQLEKAQPIYQAILELTSELRRVAQRPRHASIDLRRVNVARVIKSRKPYPKMSVPEILREIDRLQERFPGDESYEPVPTWHVRFWADMKRDNRARSYIAKIRADPRYLPYEYLSELGKKRFKMVREYRNE